MLRTANLDIVSTLYGLRPLDTMVFCLLLLCTLLWEHLLFLQLLNWSFLFRVKIGVQTLVNKRKRRRRWKVDRSLDLRSFWRSRSLTPDNHQTPQAQPFIKVHSLSLLGAHFNKSNSLPWLVGCRKLVRLSLGIRDLHQPLRSLLLGELKFVYLLFK